MKTKNKRKEILILRTEHIGDYGLGLPFIKSIRDYYPQARISIVVAPWNKDFAEATPYINEIILFNNPLIKRHIQIKDFLNPKNIFRIISFAKKIRKKKYDLIFSPSNRNYNLVFLKLFKAKKIISGVDFKFKEMSDRERMKEMISKLGMYSKGKVKLNYSKININKIDELLKKIKNKRKIIIHSITELEEKNWPLDRWSNLIDKLFEKYKDLEFLLIGSEKESKEIDKIISLIRNKKQIHNLSGKINIPELVLLIEKCDLIIGCDSGPVHLGELTKTPMLILFGPTSAKLWGPPKSQGDFIKKNPITKIGVDEVYERVKKII